MKKVAVIVLIVLLLAAVAVVVLFMPSRITTGTLNENFESKKESFKTVAEYLTKYNAKVEITGLLMPDNTFGVPKDNEEEFRRFNNALQSVMTLEVVAVVSDGETVEFKYESSGGVLAKKNYAIIYNGKSEVPGKKTEPLGETGWHVGS